MKFETYKIAELIDEISMGPFGSNIKVECFVKEGIPVLNGSNLEGFRLKEDSFRFVTKEKADSLGRANASRGDVIITHRGTLGQIVYIPKSSQYDRYVISQSQFRVRCNKKILPEYMVYYFHTKVGQGKLLSNASQVGVPALARASTTFQKIEIELPDIETQERIVSLLETIQLKIEINEHINHNLLQQAQAIFQSWFVDFSHWGNTPPDWEQGVFSDYVTVKRGGSPRPIQDYLSATGYRWLKISDVTSLQTPYITTIAEHIKESGIGKTVFLKSGSLVLSNSATPGIPKILAVDSCIHDGWLYFPQSEFSNEFLLLFFLQIRPKLVALGNGSVFTNLKTDILKSYPIAKPSKGVLEEFDNIVKPLFSLILLNTRQNNHLIRVRDSLLPKLMSGEIDVSKVEI